MARNGNIAMPPNICVWIKAAPYFVDIEFLEGDGSEDGWADDDWDRDQEEVASEFESIKGDALLAVPFDCVDGDKEEEVSERQETPIFVPFF